MGDRVLVTGGAGFIGSHLVDALLTQGWKVRVLDAVERQVHKGSMGHRNQDAEYVDGSVVDERAVSKSLADVDAVVHLAAQVGVGQSMYDMTRYVRDNCLGTAVLLEALEERRDRIRALVVASSMSIYGEGRYRCPTCDDDDARVERTLDALRERRWEPTCVVCGSTVQSLPTHESKKLESGSVYATTKRDQEDLCLVFGRAYGVRTIALRFFNVYGPRQSLSNPYTGVAAIFSSRLLNGKRPLVFEDGLQSRDFIHVSDIVQAISLSLARDHVGDVALNVGTGRTSTVLDVAEALAKHLALDLTPEIAGQFRQGDIRHCVADISAISQTLGFEPRIDFDLGMRELVEWIAEQAPPSEDNIEHATGELVEHGLIV